MNRKIDKDDLNVINCIYVKILKSVSLVPLEDIQKF